MEMTEQSILLPEAMKAQCRAAERKLEQDNRNLRTVQEKLQEFLDDGNLSGKAYATLKNRVLRFLSIIDTMVCANELDLADIRELADRVGEQKLEGRVILSEIAEARWEGEEFREQASQYYQKASGPLIFEAERQWYYNLGDYYSGRAELAERRREVWKRQEERYNEVEETTAHLFTESMSLRESAIRELSALEGAVQGRFSEAAGTLAGQTAEGIRRAVEMGEEALGNAEGMKYLLKYVNEETLCLINPRWGENKERFKEVYGEELENAEYRESLVEVPVIGDDTGVGLLQVTGSNQGYFIKDLYNSLEDGDEEKVRIEEYFNVTGEYFAGIPSSKPAKLENMAGYIYRYYPIEASVWFWAGFDIKCATFDDDGNQTNYTINDYIPLFKDGNLDNLYLGVQYAVNSMPKAKEGNDIYMKKGDVEDICEAGETIANCDTKEIKINGKTFPMPNGWADRKGDWDRAKALLEEGQP